MITLFVTNIKTNNYLLTLHINLCTYIYYFVYLYLSLLFNLKLVALWHLCEKGIYGGLCGILMRVSLRGGGSLS